MKAIQGLIVAIALGLVGAIANFYYLNTEAQKKDMVSFIGIKPDLILGRGEKITEDKIVPIDIPANHVGNLREFAYLWSNQVAVVGKSVWRTIDSRSDGGILLLRTDVLTPPQEPQLNKGDEGHFISIARTCDLSHVNPGDKVSFRVTVPESRGPTRAPKPATDAPPAASDTTTPAASDDSTRPDAADASPGGVGKPEEIGPFVVVQIGNRLGDLDVMKAAKITPVQQNVIMIKVNKNVAHEKENFDKLERFIQQYGENCYSLTILPKE